MPPIFETPRLHIRTWDPGADAPAAFEIYRDPVVMHFLGLPTGTPRKSVEEQREALAKTVARYAELSDGTGAWAIVRKSDDQVVGTCLLKRLPDADQKPTEDIEVGWHLGRAYWGNGYATESGRGAIAYGFDQLKLSTIYSVVNPANTASIRVTERLGMTPLGRTNRYYGIELELFEVRQASWPQMNADERR
jgi:ribosomal-protein-alanine N-acetyltransferase